MTITLSPKTEQALLDAAARRGVTPDAVIEERLQDLVGEEDAAQAELRARVKAARGKFAHISGGSYAFIRNKVYEKLLEERPR